jgi:hypothetical protein
LEAIRESHPELIADNMPPSWGMNKLREAVKASEVKPDDGAGRTQEWMNADAAFEHLNSILDATGALESTAIQAAAYRLRLAIAQGLGDQDRAKAAEESLSEMTAQQD